MKFFSGVFCIRFLTACVFFCSTIACRGTITRDQILTDADQIADAQLQALGKKISTDWTWGVMEAGFSVYSHVSLHGDVYRQALIQLADQAKWTLHRSSRIPFDADDYCLGQTFLDLYVADPRPDHLEPWKMRIDALIEHLKNSQAQPKLTLYWCDTLFMAPPLMCRMSAVTGDPKYLNAIDAEYWRAVDQQYDPKAHLFFRDARFVARKDKNGKQIFWSRGNGWVLAGIARILQYMPADYSSRKKYEDLFRQISAAAVAVQGDDGMWRTNLADRTEFPGPESSGTALFTYAFAWGVNHKFLDREKYLPAITKAWTGLMNARRPDHLPGYTQTEGDQPAPAKKDSTRVFCTGAYLLAASEVQKLAPLNPQTRTASTQPLVTQP